MVFKIQRDLFRASSVESFCRIEGSCGIEINTMSGGTYEYRYCSDESREAVMEQLEKIMALATNHPIINVSDPDEELEQERSNFCVINNNNFKSEEKRNGIELPDELRPKSIFEILGEKVNKFVES